MRAGLPDLPVAAPGAAQAGPTKTGPPRLFFNMSRPLYIGSGMCQPQSDRHTQRFPRRRTRLGLLACLTALLAGALVSKVDDFTTTREVYLQTGVPTPAATRLLAAPERRAKTATSGRTALGHVARPSVRPTGETRPRATPTATGRRSSIEGSGGGLAVGTSVGAAGGRDQAGAPDDDITPTRDLEAVAVDLTNRERMRKGCEPLRVDPRLARSARAHSRDMAEHDYFGHTSPAGQSPWDRMARAGLPQQRRREHREGLRVGGGGGTRLDGEQRPPPQHPELPDHDGRRRRRLRFRRHMVDPGLRLFLTSHVAASG